MNTQNTTSNTQIQTVNKKLIIRALRDPFYHYASFYKELDIELGIEHSEFSTLKIDIRETHNRVNGYSKTDFKAEVDFSKSHIYYKYNHKYVKTSLPLKNNEINDEQNITDNDKFYTIDAIEQKYILSNCEKWNENKITEDLAKDLIIDLANFLFDKDLTDYIKDSLTTDYKNFEIIVE